MNNRIDGQLWIDKNTPYRLKYHVAGEDYTVEVSAIYNIPIESLNSIALGTVVKFSGERNIAPAVFPEDIENVLGVVSSITKIENNGSVRYTAAISRAGYLVLENPNKVFQTEDLDIITNKWGDSASGIGAPVYWFIGRTLNSSGEYSYIPSTDHPGFLTFATPSGYKWNTTTVDDNTLNVGYDNLPQIGTVASYTLNGNEITKINIHLNFAKFDTSLEWSWPLLHQNHDPIRVGDCGYLPSSTSSFKIRHGLFGEHSEGFRTRNYCDTIATNNPVTGTEYTISTGYTNTYRGADRGTTIHISTPDNLYYRVSGRVNYEFDKNHS